MDEQSLVVGPTDTPPLGDTIGEALRIAAHRWPDAPALISVDQGVTLSWRDLDERTDRLAAALIGLGLVPGDRVGIWSLNRWEWAVTQFAAAKAGLILVTINPAYRLSELEYALNNSGCTALVIAPPFKTSDYPAMVRALAPELSSCTPGQLAAARLPHLRAVVQMGDAVGQGMMAFDALSEGASAESVDLAAIARGIRPDDATNIQFTSGTTGAPKGVTLSHRNILNNGYFVGRGIALVQGDRICIPVPLYHCFGMVMGNLAAVTHGAAMVYPGEGFDPRATLLAVEQARCTALYGVPTMFIALLDHPERASFDLSSLRTGIMAGSPCPIEVMRRTIDDMGVRDVSICYGMTETSPVSFQTALDAPLDVRVGTVGSAHPHVEVKIVDSDGAIVPRGTPGELCTRGYSVMLGYWNDPVQTAVVKDGEGWMHSGDLAVIDDHGHCRIVGRIKDMVIRGGENLYPREIEEFLYAHPAIRDVQLFGVADARFGEELCAWIIPNSGMAIDEAEVRRFCKDSISHNKVPRYIRFVDEFPMTVTGKVQKFVMRDRMEEELAALVEARGPSRHVHDARPND